MIRFERRATCTDPSKIIEIEKQCGVSPLIAELLCQRGYDDVISANLFLHPSQEQLLPAERFEDMDDALDCLYAAKAMEDIVCVYGDYDVDGTTATAILLDYFHRSGFRVRGYIPSRHEEGYGLNRGAIERLAAEGVRLIVTVDCGITAIDEICYAQELGLEVIVTDHHQCLDELPDCAAILNPQVSQYENKALCGAGVALKLVQAMGGIEAASNYYDFAALATVSDIVSLTAENRAIVALGLQQIHEGKAHCGLKALMNALDLKEHAIDAQDFGFYIGPCLNAAGRLANANLALQLLISQDDEEAKKIAKKLKEINVQRKEIESNMYTQAVEKIEHGEADILHDSVIMLSDESWNAGLIGIVAARLMRLYYKPVFLLAGEDEAWVGSGRSIEGVHLFQMLQNFETYFERYGGHAMAAGLSIKKEKYQAFREQFLMYCDQHISKDLFKPLVKYDLEANINELTLTRYKELNQLAPFGTENEQPVFLLKNLAMQNVRTMGQNAAHLKMQAKQLDFIAFNQGHDLLNVQKNPVNILGTLGINVWQGKTSLQVMVRAMQPVLPDNIEQYIETNYWRFAHAYYRNVARKDASDAERHTIELEWTAACHMIQDLCHKNPQGLLLVCNRPDTAKKIMLWLQEEQLLEDFDLVWGDIRDERAYNGLLLAPTSDATKNDNEKIQYDTIIWMDQDQNEITPDIHVHAITEYYISMSDSMFKNEIQISREQLIPVYQAMRALSIKKQSFLNEEAYYEAIAQYISEPRYIICAARFVFEELSFLTIRENADWVAEIDSNSEKKALEESSVFQYFS